jgi:hypothetical protein
VPFGTGRALARVRGAVGSALATTATTALLGSALGRSAALGGGSTFRGSAFGVLATLGVLSALGRRSALGVHGTLAVSSALGGRGSFGVSSTFGVSALDVGSALGGRGTLGMRSTLGVRSTLGGATPRDERRPLGSASVTRSRRRMTGTLPGVVLGLLGPATLLLLLPRGRGTTAAVADVVRRARAGQAVADVVAGLLLVLLRPRLGARLAGRRRRIVALLIR